MHLRDDPATVGAAPPVSGIGARLDPRRSLAAALGWTLVALFCLGAPLASLVVGRLATERVQVQTGALYQQYALQVSNALDGNLYDRLQWLQAMADSIPDGSAAGGTARDQSARLQVLLARWQGSLPEFAWLAIADADGRIVASTDPGEAGLDASASSWFNEGRAHGWIGEAHADPAAAAAAGRIIALAAPIRGRDGRPAGVLAARVSWDWAVRLETTLTAALRSGRPVESLVADRNGRVLIGPEGLVGTRIDHGAAHTPGAAGHVVSRWPDGGEYLAGYAVSDGAADFPGLGWTVWVREPTSTAFAAARDLAREILFGMIVIGIAGAVAGVLATMRLVRRLAAITRSADEIRAGRATELAVPTGRDEAARIGASLHTLVEGLQRERASLAALNAELDARVAARTREVERMSDENKYAAVVRERLRIARDLHDTLAHSIMALLTEIRLMRNLVRTNPAALPEELANAEAAAEDGLREARAAITTLRHNAVRDIGLGASLAQLFERFADRKGIPVEFRRDAGVDALADSRAEALHRIVEEALHNVDRHAEATRVSAFARIDPTAGGESELTLAVEDDGVGFEVGAAASRHGHFGLRGMHEQAELAGARLGIDSAPGDGTRVTVSMPV